MDTPNHAVQEILLLLSRREGNMRNWAKCLYPNGIAFHDLIPADTRETEQGLVCNAFRDTRSKQPKGMFPCNIASRKVTLTPNFNPRQETLKSKRFTISIGVVLLTAPYPIILILLKGE